MAPFSIPTPSIIPLRLPVFGGPKSLDTSTKIELVCETYLEHEIFYTLDGTKPQPYAGIIQGSKIFKYSFPFCLPAGKITIKALAINASVHTMCSSIVTKCFDVVKVDSKNDSELNPKAKKVRESKTKMSSLISGNKVNPNEKKDVSEENMSGFSIDGYVIFFSFKFLWHFNFLHM